MDRPSASPAPADRIDIDRLDLDGEPVGVPVRIVVASAAGLWLFYFLMATLRSWLLPTEYQNDMLVPRFLVSAAGVGITLVLWLLMRPFDRRPLGMRMLVALVGALPASILLAQINGFAFSSIEQKIVDNVDKTHGVRIHRDDSGNILVEMPEVPAPPTGPPPPLPPLPTAPQTAGPDGVEQPPAMPSGGATGEAPGDRASVTIIDRKGGTSDKLERWQEITDIALARYFLLVAWAALYQALLAGEGARRSERREGEFRRAAKAAELRSLRYQVNPHFLFNTLNSLSALVMTNKADKAEEMIQNLSRFYRRSLTDDPTADIPLAEEFSQQKLYLDIEAVRFPQRLRTEYDLPEQLAGACVPGMILQPLVENSVKYAIAPSTRVITIRIAARLEGENLVLTVSDDGSHAANPPVADRPGSTGSPPGHGIGLANVRQRLNARFGEDARVVSGPREDGYATTITLPWIGHDCR